MSVPDAKERRLERAQKKLGQAVARLEVAHGRARARTKRLDATRFYWLGTVLERFLFDAPALLAEVERRMGNESPRVREAFALGRTPSWFEQPERSDPKKVIDTRRYRLGMVLERLLPGDIALITRVEEMMRAQAPYVRDAFSMEGEEGASWFGRSSRGRAARTGSRG